jgi:hypothetical protein
MHINAPTGNGRQGDPGRTDASEYTMAEIRRFSAFPHSDRGDVLGGRPRPTHPKKERPGDFDKSWSDDSIRHSG